LQIDEEFAARAGRRVAARLVALTGLTLKIGLRAIVACDPSCGTIKAFSSEVGTGSRE
jgi:hypothetical protein